MKSLLVLFGLSLVLISGLPSAVFGQTAKEKPMGELGGSIGWVFPQGDFVTFSDPGPVFNLRLNLRPKSLRAVGLKFEFGGSFFESESENIWVDVPGGPTILAKHTVSQTAWTLHTGLQFGSGTRRGFFRPRVSLSPGLYVFNIKDAIRWDWEDENFYEENETQAKFGWRGAIGTSLFFKTGWGLTFDFVLDRVYSLHKSTVVDNLGRISSTSTSAEFHGYLIGVVFPLDKL